MSKLPKAVFFDWDGTLADSYKCIEGAHDYALSQLGLKSRGSGWFGHFFGKPREYIYDTIYGDQRAEAQEVFEQYLQAHHTDLIVPIEGAVEMLDWLRDRGIMLGIVTNKRKDFVAAEIAAFGWADYFVTVVGAGEAPEDKPSPQPLHLALERAGYDGAISDVWFVGDTQADLDCAQRAGAPCLFFRADGQRAEAFGDYDVLGDFSDYRNFLAFLAEKA